jgi:hypothetical protein
VNVKRPKRVAIVIFNLSVSPTTVCPWTFGGANVVAAGQGPMATFEWTYGLHNKFVEFYEAGKIASALCQSVAVMRYAKLANGEFLAKGKTVTGFANIEEDFAACYALAHRGYPQGAWRQLYPGWPVARICIS